ncbi:ABC transporter permease [Nonomuraea jiangxiensis]|uniref:Peptide/nickel transport system permease protein n=1 Tax=Nonomuraea jiangxiensis TaxID=633440 RepID=A0A1G9BXM8_9ACTN|nr:ABC transporter permease [Nonomuraea jiangxiensis]SDK44222.1 peptide/nickel transport system permease protein [Nonomuraea jiangxiensis]
MAGDLTAIEPTPPPAGTARAEGPRRAAGPALRALAALGRRLLLLPVLLLVVFATMEFLPGDAARSTIDRGAGAAAVAERRAELGLDRPLWSRFWDWITGLPRGDMGVTARGEQVADVIGRHFTNTLLLAGLAFALTLVVALALAGLAMLKSGTLLDRLVSGSATIVAALPEFVVAGVLVLVLSLWAGLLPAVTVPGPGGLPAEPVMLVLPVLALAIPQIGWNARVAHAALADECSAPHVEAAVLDGLPARRVLLRHLLPGALPAIATGAVTSTGMLLGGAVVVETIFNYPGIGSVLASAVRDRDTPLVAGVVTVTGVAILVLLIAADAVRARASGRR